MPLLLAKILNFDLREIKRSARFLEPTSFFVKFLRSEVRAVALRVAEN